MQHSAQSLFLFLASFVNIFFGLCDSAMMSIKAAEPGSVARSPSSDSGPHSGTAACQLQFWLVAPHTPHQPPPPSLGLILLLSVQSTCASGVNTSDPPLTTPELPFMYRVS